MKRPSYGNAWMGTRIPIPPWSTGIKPWSITSHTGWLDEGLGQFRFGAKFSSWLYSIVLNKCRDHLKLTKDTVSTDAIAEVMADNRTSPEQDASARQSKDVLQKALDVLPAEYREVLILKHIEELEYEEIASITGTGVGALKVRAHRGREMLRKVLEQAGVTHG
jgi:RNA polymerase sigma-70 factor (ECF subfamily)